MQTFQKRVSLGFTIVALIIAIIEATVVLHNSYTNVENDGFDPRATPLSILAGYERGATCTLGYGHWRCDAETITALRTSTLDGHDTVYYTESYDGDHIPLFSFKWFVVEVGNFTFFVIAFLMFVVARIIKPDDDDDSDAGEVADPHPSPSQVTTMH